MNQSQRTGDCNGMPNREFRVKKRKPASGIGLVLAFIGLTGRRDDFVATAEHIDKLGLPAWADWSFIVFGTAWVIYAFWPRSEVAEAMDREWSEEGAIKAYEIRQKHHRALFPQYVGSFAIFATSVVFLVLITTCEGPGNNEIRSQQIYLQCLKTDLGNPELCERIILGKPIVSRKPKALEDYETNK